MSGHTEFEVTHWFNIVLDGFAEPLYLSLGRTDKHISFGMPLRQTDDAYVISVCVGMMWRDNILDNGMSWKLYPYTWKQCILIELRRIGTHLQMVIGRTDNDIVSTSLHVEVIDKTAHCYFQLRTVMGSHTFIKSC